MSEYADSTTKGMAAGMVTNAGLSIKKCHLVEINHTAESVGANLITKMDQVRMLSGAAAHT